MKSDSLLVRKLQNLRTQPPTARGKLIDWYCSLADKPSVRIALFVGITVFTFLHLLAFTLMLRYDFTVSSTSTDISAAALQALYHV